MKASLPLALCCILAGNLAVRANELGEHGYADSGGVKIHYVTSGTGPLVILVHGHPDFWYGWRYQIPALTEHFQVVAIDLRGYNKSDRPAGVENYAIDKLIGDIDAVIGHFGRDKATLVGHDWGGFVCWHFAMVHPDKTKRLVILNLPHPRGLSENWRRTRGSIRPVLTRGSFSREAPSSCRMGNVWN